MITKDQAIQRLKEPWDCNTDHHFWRSTEDYKDDACIAVSTYCEMLRLNIGWLPVDVENILVMCVAEHGYSVSQVCQMASRYCTQEWLNSYIDEPTSSTYQDYVKNRFKKFVERKLDAEV